MIDVTQELKKILAQSPTAPFLFLGSGFSRRYLGLEDWKNLLGRFGSKLPSGFIRYVSESNGDLALAAERMAQPYSDYWWSLPNSQETANQPDWHTNISSPLRYDICEYLNSCDMKNKKLQNELDILTSKKTIIDGIITTNWDLLLENIFEHENYKVYIGQGNLLFSNPQKIAEIYKIHGCCSDPKSLILTKTDYEDFHKKNQYLAAKLLSIFLEHSVIFIGYSLDDENIRSILCSISEMMSNEEHRTKLAKNLIFINWEKDVKDSISQTHFNFSDNKSIPITEIKTDNFSKIYLALQGKERKIPAYILRIFREQFYEIVQGESPENKLYCPTDIDEIIQAGKEIEFVAGFGVAKEGYNKVGMKGIDFKMILSDAIYGDIEFDRAQVLNDILSDICKPTVYVPIHRFIKTDPNFKPLKNAPENFKNLFKFNEKSFVSKIAKGYRDSYKRRNLVSISILEIIQSTQYSEPIRMDYLGQFIVDNPTNENLKVLESYLKERFEENWNHSNFKRLVCIYDCLVNK